MVKLNDAQQSELVDAVRQESRRIGMDPQIMLTIMSYETGGTLDPWQKGPVTQWGTHRGLIQMGETQRKEYGYKQSDTIANQVKASADFLVGRGWKPGMSEVDAYSIVNAGGPGLENRTDEYNGGAPGTVADKVGSPSWRQHAAKMKPLLARFPDALAGFVRKTEGDATLASVLAGKRGRADGVAPLRMFEALDDMNVTAAPVPGSKPGTGNSGDRYSTEIPVMKGAMPILQSRFEPYPGQEKSARAKLKDRQNSNEANPFDLKTPDLKLQAALLDRSPALAEQLIVSAGRDPRLFGL